MENEIWKPIKSHEGIYEVSNLGRVKSLKFGKSIILKYGISTTGYKFVNLRNNNKTKSRTIHQLIAEAFLNHIPCGYEIVIDHINDNKLDNRLVNLQLVTNRFNSLKAQGKYSSRFKGVNWSKSSQKWVARIYINGKTKYLGRFLLEEDAANAYKLELDRLNKNLLIPTTL